MTPKAVPAAQAWVRNAGMKGDGVNNLLFKISMKTRMKLLSSISYTLFFFSTDRKIVSNMLDVVHDAPNVEQVND